MAGIIASTSCNRNPVTIIATEILEDFPSGSAIEFYDDQLILIGDDATRIIVVDKNYKRVDSITIDTFKEARIPKDIKPDYEASTIININNTPTLVAFGSGSTIHRNNALLVSLPVTTRSTFSVNNIAPLYEQLTKAGIPEINIEGATTLGSDLVLANRANQKQQINSFIVVRSPDMHHMVNAAIHISKINLPASKLIVGISGLSYVPAKDLLLFTASTEETASSYEDGAIGDSYIGMIENASSALQQKEIVVKKLINLTQCSSEFEGQKIESLTVEKFEKDKLILHLVADNDNGTSKLFKLSLEL